MARKERRVAMKRPSDDLAMRPLTEPDAAHCDRAHHQYAEMLDRHATALAAGESVYTDPATGLLVLTAGFLASRGWCCHNVCRHCPYATPST